MSSAYSILKERFKKLSSIEGALSMLHWDSATMMPKSSYPLRATQIADLDSLHHEMLTAKDMPSLLKEAKDEVASSDAFNKRNVALMEHSYIHASAVDSKLVEKMSEASVKNEHAWRDAKEHNDFKSFAPLQQEVLDLVRESAKQKADVLGLSLYDSLLDMYDEGRRSADIDPVFTKLKDTLPDLIQEIVSHQQNFKLPPSGGNFPIEKQQALGKNLMETLGFDFDKGRIDVSVHPFCGGIPGDVRLTSRYDVTDAASGIMGVLHETGHALYEQGLPEDWLDQPVGNALGMSMHESQSLFIEMQISRTFPFQTFFGKQLRNTFGLSEKDWSDEALFQQATKVTPSLIRVDADEVTYPMHVILRYELEKALIAGDMQIADLPAAWNKGMLDLLHVKVPNDTQGCLQDIHWPEGAFGYFPTYTLGAIAASCWAKAMRRDIPDMWDQVERGEFKQLVSWLRKNIHQKGSSVPADELMQQVTGKTLDSDTYIAYLKAKYLA